jgi:hypothetical protein
MCYIPGPSEARGSIATSESSPSRVRTRKVVMVMVVPVMMPCRVHLAFVANRVVAAVVGGGRQIRSCLLRVDWGGGWVFKRTPRTLK